jgi:hypothetical protein
MMTRHLMPSLAIAALAFVSSTPAAAEPPIGNPAVYDTVDGIVVWGFRIIVTGIISGQSAQSTFVYLLFDEASSSGFASDTANRCDRLALLAMSKPGRFQFAVAHVPGSVLFRCGLTVRAP